MHSALCRVWWVQLLHCSSWCLETYQAAEWLQAAQLADVKWQQAVFEVLLSYHPFWLRLGLETVVGQLLPADTGDRFLPCSCRQHPFCKALLHPASAMALLYMTFELEISKAFHSLSSPLLLP